MNRSLRGEEIEGSTEMKMYEIACPYCGAIKMIEGKDGLNEKEQAALAAKNCTCDKAIEIKRKENIEQKVKLLFGEGSQDHGFDDALSEDEIKLLISVCENIINGNSTNTTMTLSNGNKAKVTVVKDRIKLVRESKNHVEAKI